MKIISGFWVYLIFYSKTWITDEKAVFCILFWFSLQSNWFLSFDYIDFFLLLVWMGSSSMSSSIWRFRRIFKLCRKSSWTSKDFLYVDFLIKFRFSRQQQNEQKNKYVKNIKYKCRKNYIRYGIIICIRDLHDNFLLI